jgi:hypothetical protein
MANVTNPGKKIRISRKEQKSGQISTDKIQVKRKVVAMNKPEADTPAKMEFKHGNTKKSYTKKDVRSGDPNYGKESKSKPTPEFVKKAQRAGVDTAEKNGKAYAAGETKSTKTSDQHKVRIKVTPVMKMHQIHGHTVKDQPAAKSNINQNFGKGPKRRLERVKWLKGRNKKTEAGYGG